MVPHALKTVQSHRRKNQNDKKLAIFLKMCFVGNNVKTELYQRFIKGL